MSQRRLALISGGTSAIGGSIIDRLHADGFAIAFTFCRNRAEAERLQREYNALAYRLDFLEEPMPSFGDEVAVLVNNAGINLSGTDALTTSEKEIEESIRVNVIGPLRLAKLVIPGMLQAGWGRIININSLYGLMRPPRRLSYTISKYSLTALTGTLANELAATGITVNDVCPGPVDSSMLRAIGSRSVDEGRHASLDEYLERTGGDVPIRRLVRPSEVAAAVSYLASDGGAACTGVSLRVDGGIAT